MWSVKKKFFYVLYCFLGKWLPESRHFMRIPQKVRGWFARRIMDHVGMGVNIERGAYFTPECKIGNDSGIGVKCEVYGPVTIGNNVMMGPEVIIYTANHNHDVSEVPFRKQGYSTKPVTIGDNVWIGRRTMFMAGSSVGNNVIIAAGSVITKNIPDNVLVGGVPAKIISSL